MKLTSLFSGSSGNCLLVEHNNTTLLIDAGLPGNRIQAMLAVADVIPER
jgi:phosphoribosyl 1,2-cyclic phosphodiesterase